MITRIVFSQPITVPFLDGMQRVQEFSSAQWAIDIAADGTVGLSRLDDGRMFVSRGTPYTFSRSTEEPIALMSVAIVEPTPKPPAMQAHAKRGKR